MVFASLAVAEALAYALESMDGIDRAIPAGTSHDLAAAIDSNSPDVVLVGIGLDNASIMLGVLDLPGIRDRHIPVVFLTRHEQSSLGHAAQNRGAAGFLRASTSLRAIADALQIVSRGGSVYEGTLNKSSTRRASLPTEREVELLRALALGLTNHAAAHKLDISPRTVESHLRRMFSRYGVASRSQLLMHAVREGWISLVADQSDDPVNW